jgi:DnaK suppressor protein
MTAEHQHGPERALTQAQREELRRTLEAKRKQLLHVLREHEDRDEEPGEDPLEKEPTDAADLAESAIEDNDRIALADHNLELLEEIDHALSRLDDGTYGLSEATGLPIPYERLRAVPWARYGADEAERMEQVARGAIGR